MSSGTIQAMCSATWRSGHVKKLLHQVIYRFLMQVKRHMREEYGKPDAGLRDRFEKHSG